jgi:stage II sporulation protein D
MNKKQIISIFLALFTAGFFVLFFFTPFKVSFRPEGTFPVRVRIAAKVKEASISSIKECDISRADTGKVVHARIPLPEGTQMIFSKEKIIIGNHAFFEKRLRISPVLESGVNINGILYRGEIDISRKADGVDIINRLELEDYLKGVIPREVSHFWPMAVLRAQAIASRSFAVFEVSRRKSKDHDLTADTFSQVYGGRSAEKWRSNLAVEYTRGRVLEYRGSILPGYFHSCCGGHTEDISLVWGGKSIEPLRGVRSKWCRWSPHFRWSVRVPNETLLEKLNASGYYFESIDDMREGTRDPSKRLEYVRVKSKNKWFDIPINDFLGSVGRATLKSANFRIKRYPFFYSFSGYGWGHGVGMCQWCAFTLSLRRWNEKRILDHFYPRANVVELRELFRTK